MIHKPTTPKIYEPQDGSCVLSLDARDVRGSKIYDRSGKGNHGAITGAVLKPGNYGIPVLDFDGVDDNIECADTNLDLTKPFSVFAIIKIGAGNTWSRIVNHDIVGRRFLLSLANISGGKYSLGGGIDGVTERRTEYIMKIGIFYFVSFVWDGAVIKFYINAINQSTSSLSFSFSDPGHFYIGLRSGYLFNGVINNVQLFKREVLASEISQYFNKIKNQYGM